MKTLANDISAWIKKYTNENNRKALVVGVSGGVDSALVSTLCAMTGLPTHVVIMPCESKEDQTIRGVNHCKWLKSKYNDNVIEHVFDLTDTFLEFKKKVVNKKYDNQLAYANTKSRLRMIVLYQIATCNDGLVVGTGNKVEDYGVGFFTKYGDGGVDISPISDLYKSEVRQMCRELEILPELCEAVPTDGLWNDSRTDESQLGATYDELEWAMKNINNSNNVDNYTDRQKEVINIYNTWHNRTKHKLSPIPSFVRS